jgi:hypothetical protein
MGAMINDEVVVVGARSGNNLTLLRGCADTIPQAHAANSRIWFFEDSIARLPVEYTPTETISIKPLPRTSSAVVAIENSPPIGLTLTSRFARPYAPGDVQVNGQRWDTPGTVLSPATAMTISWATRNRVLQADLLVPHTEGPITPEAGQVTEITMHRVSDDAVVGVYTSTGNSFVYTVGQANTDLGSISVNTAMYAMVRASRGALKSRSSYRINFTASPSVAATQSFIVSYVLDTPPVQTFSVTYTVD